MAGKFYLGIDQGTSGTTAVLFNEAWEQVSRGYREITQIYPRAGWVEHDPLEVWDSVLFAVQQALAAAGADASEIACLGIDHEGESVVMWDGQTGVPVCNAIVWQDKRTAHAADALAARHGDRIREITALPCDAYFSATKYQWILQNVPDAAALLGQGRLLAGNMDAWIVWRMTHGRVHATDASTASRTMLMDVRTCQWDAEMLSLFDIPHAILPEIRDSATLLGVTCPEDFLGASIPVSGLLNDQQAALFGQACTHAGECKTTYGTGCFLLMHTGDTHVSSPSGLVPTVAWRHDGQTAYALDGGVYIAGAAIQWLRDGLKIIRSASETEAMALQAGSDGGVCFVPAFAGLGAPYRDPYARGMLIGVTGGTTREQVVRATLEAIAYQVCDVAEAMRRDTSVSVTRMRCDGGAAANRFLMQFQSDMLGIPIDVPSITETSALGAAYMAALGIGALTSLHEVRGYWRLGRRYEPRMGEDERLQHLHRWRRAVERAQHWAED